MSNIQDWRAIFPGYFDRHPSTGGKWREGKCWNGTASFILEMFEGRAVGTTKAVEVGVGYGGQAKALAERGIQVFGCDIGRDLFEHLAGIGVEPTLVEGDGSLPFPDRSIDVVYSCAVFQHIEPDQAVRYLEESRRVLRAGGQFAHQTIVCGTGKGLPEPSVGFQTLEPFLPEWVTVNGYGDPDAQWPQKLLEWRA